MGVETKIKWCDSTWNPWRGCAKIGPGCLNCYAERQSRRNPKVLGCWGPDAPRVIAKDAYWRQPYQWNREVVAKGKPQTVFLGSLMDFFEARDDLRLPRARAWNTILYTPWLTWLILTKRPAHAVEWCRRWQDLAGESEDDAKLVRGPEATRRAHPSGRGQIFADMLEAMGQPPAGCAYPTFDWMEGVRWWPPFPGNVRIGFSVSTQADLDVVWPHVGQIPGGVWLSAEPLLGPLNLRLFDSMVIDSREPGLGGAGYGRAGGKRPNAIRAVVVGGESGDQARPCSVDWLQSIAQQCTAAGVPCMVKQLGARPMMRQDTIEGRRAGDDPESEWPPGTRFGTAPGHMGTECQGRRAVLADKVFGANLQEWPADLQRFAAAPDWRAV